MIKCPWDLDQDGQMLVEHPDHRWVIEYSINKNIPVEYFKPPIEQKEQQLRAIMEYLLGPRNFILLVSKNSGYVWELYYYLALTWAMTTNKGFYILDIKELDLNSNEYKELLQKIETINLLIIPYTDPQGYDLRRKRNILGNILAKRKARKMPFITDIFVKKLPSYSEIPSSVTPLANVFGENSIPLFLDQNSNSKIIKIGAST
jgi:hypothetical protein